MSALTSLVQTPAAQAVGWTLFHSLWEGALAAIVLAAGLLLTRSPRARYACACLTMCAILAAFVLTLASVRPQALGTAAPLAHPVLRAPLDAGPSATAISVRYRLDDVLPWLVPFWLAGIILFQARTAASWMAARRLRLRGVCGAPDAWIERLTHLRARLRVSRPVALLETALAEVPVVIGYLRPVILIPAGLLTGMPASQVEAILLHELAHIRRRDYLVNVMQTVVEGILFYHPAIWWISNLIRAEREKCCDDLVVAINGDAHAYASALAVLEQSRWATQQTALAATGGNLMKRIHRLLYEPKVSAFAPLISAAILTIAIVGGLTAWQAAANPPQPKMSPYTKWLQEEAPYIIDDRERAAFLSLKTDAERDHFIEQFWLRRDPTPGTPENEFKTEHYRRLAYANSHFKWQAVPGWKTDRGRIYILYGPPDELESHPGNAPTESWMYHTIKGIGDRVIVEFVDQAKAGDYRMTMDPNPEKGTSVRRP